jgi:hypothetical protein
MMDPAKFEQERLALFTRYGFEGKSRRVTDREAAIEWMLALP